MMKKNEGTKKRSKRKHESDDEDDEEEEETLTNDPYAFIDDPEFGLNEDYEEQQKAYAEQQVEKRKKVKLDPDAGTIAYKKTNTTAVLTNLTVVPLDTIGKHWEDIKGNQEFGTYATKVVVDGQPFYFRANNTQDIGLAPMYIGEDEDSETYSSSTFRKFVEIGAELDEIVEKADDKAKLRKRMGKAILNALKGPTFGQTTTKSDDLREKDRFLFRQAVAEIAAIWTLDLFRSGKNREKILAHQQELLTSTKPFREIFKEGVYLGMKAATLRT